MSDDKSLAIFISSKMMELREERKTLEALLPTLGQDTINLHPWIFEIDAMASTRSIRKVYLDALAKSELYIGIFWNDYGEYTIDEFYRAGELGIPRHIYVKDVEPEKRDPRLSDFLNKQGDVRFGITARWFRTPEELGQQVTKAVQQWLIDRQISHHSAVSAVLAEDVEDIPELPKKLIGREDLIAQAQDVLEEGEHLLLHGFGGMGKSALAASIAAGWIEADKGPVLWITAGDAHADSLFEAIGQTLNEQQRIASVQGDARIKAVRDLLSEQHVSLVVLDDVWNGQALARFMRMMPRALPLMITSRQRYPLDEIITVGELQPEQALELLVYHARRKDLKDDAGARALCETLGHHAFALEIAGKTIKVYNFAPKELVERIENTPHDLNMPAGFGELNRKGIKSLLDVSIDALDKNLHDLFLMLGGLFEPNATPELVSLVIKSDPEGAADQLSKLELRGLVNGALHKHIQYYKLHGLAYSYARTMFIDKGLSNIPFVDACRQYVDNHVEDLDELDVEQGNIIEAAEAAYFSNKEDALVDMLFALAVRGPYFAARGFTATAIRLMREAIEAARSKGQVEEAHYLLSKLGNAYRDLTHEIDAALTAYQDALALARALDDKHREAILLTVIGTVRFLQGADDADSYHQQAEDIARANDDRFALCQILSNRGHHAASKQHFDECLRFSAEATALAEELELAQIQFISLLNLGSAYQDTQQYDAALQAHQRAYALAQAEDNHHWMANVLWGMGEDYHDLQQREQAQKYLTESMALWRKIGANAEVEDLTHFMQERGYATTS